MVRIVEDFELPQFRCARLGGAHDCTVVDMSTGVVGASTRVCSQVIATVLPRTLAGNGTLAAPLVVVPAAIG